MRAQVDPSQGFGGGPAVSRPRRCSRLSRRNEDMLRACCPSLGLLPVSRFKTRSDDVRNVTLGFEYAFADVRYSAARKPPELRCRRLSLAVLPPCSLELFGRKGRNSLLDVFQWHEPTIAF